MSVPTLFPEFGVIPDITLSILSIIVFILGLIITVLAYQGYQKNQSRPMFYFTLGFGCLFLVNFSGLVLYRIIGLPEVAEIGISLFAQAIGLSLILYALWTD